MSSAVTLFEIEDDLQALVKSESLVTQEQEEAYRLTLAGQLKAAVEKRQRMGEFIRYCELMQNNCAAEIARIQKVKESFAAAEERARECVVFTIKSLGADEKGKYPKLAGRTLTLSVQRNPKSVEIQDGSLIPERYRNAVVKLPLEIWEKVLMAFDEDGSPEMRAILQAADERRSVEVNKTALKASIESGQEVPGADLVMGKLRCKVS